MSEDKLRKEQRRIAAVNPKWFEGLHKRSTANAPEVLKRQQELAQQSQQAKRRRDDEDASR